MLGESEGNGMNLQICPECHCLTIEFDPHQGLERCLNRRCGWVNRERRVLDEEPKSFQFSRVMEARVKARNGADATRK